MWKKYYKYSKDFIQHGLVHGPQFYFFFYTFDSTHRKKSALVSCT
jgi:hypothetical protein